MKDKKAGFIVFCLTVLIVVAHGTSFAQKDSDLQRIYADAKERKGKRPVIIIPGILGSEIVNSKTGEKVWYSIKRSGTDDLRLPVALNPKQSRDDLVPGDIIRRVEFKILPDVKVYQKLIETLTTYGGYEEASWSEPPAELEDKIFVFPYDWRRDNVETAHYLLEKIDKLRADTGRPDAKFNILAHSMGGLVARYAVMYGKEDLPAGRPAPNWSGEKYFSKIFMFGTPNEGSATALETILKGRSSLGGSIDLPFVRNLSSLDIATMPAVFQLMPHARTTRFYDEELNPLKIDLYDIANWKKYGWAVFEKDDTFKDFTEADTARFEQYFSIVLQRAKKFHEALNVESSKRLSVGMFLIGSDCKTTLDALVVYRDPKSEKWVTLTKPDSFTNSKGVKVTGDELRKLMIKPGDGRVTRASLLAETLAADRRRSNLFDSALPLTYALFICEDHDDITSNLTVQNNLLTALVSEADK